MACRHGYARFIIDELVFDLVVSHGSNQNRTTADTRCIGGLMVCNHSGWDGLPLGLGGVFELLDQFVLSVHIQQMDL